MSAAPPPCVALAAAFAWATAVAASATANATAIPTATTTANPTQSATPTPTDETPREPKEQPPATAPEEFELLPPQKPPDAAALAAQERLTKQLRLRRQMLQLHQLGGYATMAALTATVVLGQINYIDKYGGGGDTGRFITPHKIAAFTSAGIFAATALLAYLAPTPLERPARLDTATLHKVALGVATAGMATQIVLGILTTNREGRVSQRDFALAHQIVGYTTLLTTAAGFLVLTFE